MIAHLSRRQHKSRGAWGAAAAVLLALATLTSPANGASLQVVPTSLTLQARQNADGLWLSNTGSQPLHAQVRVYRWTQVDGEDRLEPTRDLTVSPPMLQVPAGERQLVRVIRLGPPPMGAEASYRLIVDELPVPASAPAEGSAAADGRATKHSGLQFVLRYSLPVFLLPATPRAPGAVGPAETALQPDLQIRLVRTGEQTQLEVANDGPAHAQIEDLVLVDAAGERQTVRAGLAGYVLPGQRRRWNLPVTLHPSASASGVFKARVNGEFTERTLLSRDPAATTSGVPR
ncbi:molecular chaperone [Variovorax sp. LjRoot175]|uniref:fimbrial biogenesis chaperone n=1 Tax=Variovorax sp. LjRoot175 TaxID=3342276 RepID=UPI003ECD3793